MMYGLIMLREYLDEILDGTKAYDARAYNTNKRGLIALVDTMKSAIIGTVELVGIEPITAEKYCKWHATGKWAGMQFQVEDMNATYWAYCFINPRRLAKHIKIKKTGRVWTKLDDSIEKGLYDFAANSLLGGERK